MRSSTTRLKMRFNRERKQETISTGLASKFEILEMQQLRDLLLGNQWFDTLRNHKDIREIDGHTLIFNYFLIHELFVVSNFELLLTMLPCILGARAFQGESPAPGPSTHPDGLTLILPVLSYPPAQWHRARCLPSAGLFFSCAKLWNQQFLGHQVWG